MNPTSTPQGLLTLEHPDQLESLIDRSHQRPVLIFKHSRTCGTSAQAFDELQTFLEEGATAEVYMIDVLRHRAASQAVATHFGIRHESPQLLVVHGGEVGWHGSHFRVTIDSIRKALGTLPTV